MSERGDVAFWEGRLLRYLELLDMITPEAWGATFDAAILSHKKYRMERSSLT